MNNIKCTLIVILLLLFIIIGGFILRLEFLSYKSTIITNQEKIGEHIVQIAQQSCVILEGVETLEDCE